MSAVTAYRLVEPRRTMETRIISSESSRVTSFFLWNSHGTKTAALPALSLVAATVVMCVCVCVGVGMKSGAKEEV